jgi:phosphopantetheine--protein transferase-like protein
VRSALPCRDIVSERLAGPIEEIRLDQVRVLVTSEPRGADVHRTLLARILPALLDGVPGPGVEGDLAGLVVAHDRLGKPTLVDGQTGAESGVGVSFSHGAQRSWAAAACDARVGVDTAEVVDFDTAYPYGRVFTDRELESALSLHGGQLSSAAARLWATKEASVKALGRGFHACDYKEVEVVARIPSGGDLRFAVSVRGLVLTAWTRRDRSSWLAVAVAGPAVSHGN